MSSYFTYWTGAAVPDLRPTPSSVTYGYAVDLLSSCKEQLSFLRAVYEELKAADPHSSASYINLYNQSTEAGISEYMMVCLPVVLVGYFVFTANKSVSALSQTGSMQSRATYAQRDKRAKAEDAALVAALEAHRKEADKAAAEKEADKAAAEKKAAAKASPPAASAPRVALPPSLPKITVSAGDKIIYSWGVMNVALTAYFLGHFPQHFYIWHTPKCVIMLVYRWVEWKLDGSGRHYLFYDFCYWANFLCLYYLWVNPHSAEVFKVVFMVANGPLAWAVLAFNNSLIFHSLQHMVSAFIHISPMLLSYCLRWHPGEEVVVCPDAGCETVSSMDLIMTTMQTFYVPWIVIYYVWVFIFLRDRAERKHATTLFDHVCKIGGERVFKAISSNTHLQKAFFMLCHYSFASLTMVLAAVLFHHKKSHFSFLFIICFASCWNGSHYYMRALEQKNALKRERERLLSSDNEPAKENK